MTDKSDLHDLARKAAIDAANSEAPKAWYTGVNMTVAIVDAAIAAYLAIAPQAPVSAVPVVKPLLATRFKLSFDGKGRCTVFRKDQVEELFGQWVWLIDATDGGNDPLYASPPPAQADDGKDAEIGYLKIEMEGVENAKEEIGRLLGLTEEFRWKRISAAIHEQKRLIRELVAALKKCNGDWTADVDRAVVLALAKAKAKASGFSVRTEGEQG